MMDNSEKTSLRSAIEQCLGKDSTVTKLSPTLAVVLTAKSHHDSYKRAEKERIRAQAQAEVMGIVPRKP